MAVYMDSHVLVNTLEFLGKNNIHDSQKMNRSILTILSRTNRLLDCRDTYEKIVQSGDASLQAESTEFNRNYGESTERQQAFHANKDQSPAVAQAIAYLSSHTLEAAKGGSDRIKKEVYENNISSESIEECVMYAKALYDVGHYSDGRRNQEYS